MRVSVVGGITVGGHSGGLMRQGAGIGHGRSGSNMMSNGRSRVSDQRSRVSNQSGCGMCNVRNRGMVHGGSALVDDGVEAIVIIGGVLHGAHRTVGLDQRVGALDNIAIAHLMLRLHIAGVRVGHTVVVVVLGVGLQDERGSESALVACRTPTNRSRQSWELPDELLCRLAMAYSAAEFTHTYMVVQTLVVVSTMSTVAGIGQGGARGVQCGTSTVQDTGGGDSQDGQADEGLTRCRGEE